MRKVTFASVEERAGAKWLVGLGRLCGLGVVLAGISRMS